MENGLIFLMLLLGCLILINLIATYIIFNTFFKVKERRAYQLIFVWVIPFIGAIFAVYINREDYFEEQRLKKVGNNLNISESEAIGMGASAGHQGGR